MLKGGAHLAPVAQADLDVEAHDLGNGPGKLHVVALGVALFIQVLIRGIVVVAAHDVGFGGIHGGKGPGGSGGKGLGQEKKKQKKGGAPCCPRALGAA